MTYRTYTLIGRGRKSKKPSSCLVCWPEEDNNLSILDVKKIISPSPDDLAPDTFCKVKGFEKHLCKILALGSAQEMKTKMEEMTEDDPAAKSPPRKKACVVGKQSVSKRKRDKEIRVPSSSRGKKAKEKGSIILVGAKMPIGNSGEHCHEEPKQSNLQQNAAVSLEHDSPEKSDLTQACSPDPKKPGHSPDPKKQIQHDASVVVDIEEFFSSVSSLPSPISNKLVVSPYENFTEEQSVLDCGKIACHPHPYRHTQTHTS